jgi:hypothetical protein
LSTSRGFSWILGVFGLAAGKAFGGSAGRGVSATGDAGAGSATGAGAAAVSVGWTVLRLICHFMNSPPATAETATKIAT